MRDLDSGQRDVARHAGEIELEAAVADSDREAAEQFLERRPGRPAVLRPWMTASPFAVTVRAWSDEAVLRGSKRCSVTVQLPVGRGMS